MDAESGIFKATADQDRPIFEALRRAHDRLKSSHSLGDVDGDVFVNGAAELERSTAKT